MAYWVFDQNGICVAVVHESDPDLQRVLMRAQRPVPMAQPAPSLPPQSPYNWGGAGGGLAQQPVWAQPAAAAPPAARRHPNTAADAGVVYRVRHVPTGRFLGEGLDPRKETAPKTWPNRGNAKNAISHAVRRKLAAASEYEIVPLTLGGG